MENAQLPTVSIITVGMNHRAFMQNLLESLYRTAVPETKVEMIYVDNCSSDGSVGMISENYPQVKIIKNSTPLGFGANNNVGVKNASGKYVAIINPDITLQENSVDSLVRFYENLPYDALLVPKLLNPDGTLQYSARGFITFQTFYERLKTRGNDKAQSAALTNYLMTDIDAGKVQFVDWAIGAAFFMSRDLYNKLGGFDEDYFLYVEDTDLCLRAWKQGNPVIYVPQSEMVHNHMRSSSRKIKPAMMHLKSYLTYFRKHGTSVPNYSALTKLKLPEN